MRELILCALLTVSGCHEGPTIYTPQFEKGEIALMKASGERVMVLAQYCRHSYSNTTSCMYGVRGQGPKEFIVREFELEKQ